MASTFTRPDSEFIQLRFKDASGAWKSKATKFRKSNPGEQHQARLLARELSIDERLQRKATAVGHWEDWVDAWMIDQYGAHPETSLKVNRRHWRKLLLWMKCAGLHSPAQISYNAALDYRSARLSSGGGNNTIIQEIKFLSHLMNEAVRRGYATANPLVKMGLKKDPPKEKQPWTEEQILTVMKAVRSAPNFIRVSFLLGLYQADRLRQCAVPLDSIDLKRSRITYWRTIDGKPLTKGNKPFTQPIDARLLPELKEIIAERRRGGFLSLCDIPALPSLEWRRFLDSLGFHDISHHGLRVTWITRAATSGRDGRRGVFQAEAKRFVNHGSTSVHQIYQRLNADDVAHVPGEMDLPAVPKD